MIDLMSEFPRAREMMPKDIPIAVAISVIVITKATSSWKTKIYVRYRY